MGISYLPCRLGFLTKAVHKTLNCGNYYSNVKTQNCEKYYWKTGRSNSYNVIEEVILEV
jgi:hypothetical protein